MSASLEDAKKLAAYAAVDDNIKPEHRVIGIGSGTTVPYVVERLAQDKKGASSERWFIPTSFQSSNLITDAGLKLGDIDQFTRIDVTIDGADEIDGDLNAIKGGGACLYREKVLAEAADTFVLVADFRKDSKIFGTSWKKGVPVEVVPFGWRRVFQTLQAMGGEPVLRMGVAKAGPVVTDNGNFIIDYKCTEEVYKNPGELLKQVKLMTGVVEVGLFVQMAKAAYFGQDDGTVIVRYPNGETKHLTK